MINITRLYQVEMRIFLAFPAYIKTNASQSCGIQPPRSALNQGKILY